jgi:hypothetical protein
MTTVNTLRFFVAGQGVYLFTQASDSATAAFKILNQEETDGLAVIFGNGYVHAHYLKTLEPLFDSKNQVGLIPNHGAYYWFSLDSHNHRLYAGIGEPRLETAIYQFQLPPNQEKFLESLVKIRYTSAIPIRLLHDPITRTIPLLVKNTDELTMSDVARGVVLPNANLSPIAQKLYNCIAGKRFVLDDVEFPEFSAAIEHSIRTPGCWCYRRLAEKATEFSKDPKPLETYLRITLGENNGESPGVPYVMEIWPIGHYSPIHSHAGANAVIRVLHGNIHVQLFPFLCDDATGVKEFGSADFKKDDITWISPTLNQVHRLTNLPTSTQTCITIQCYMYDESNKVHYDYFDYLDDDGKKQQYTPDSDMDFLAFKALMKREWLELRRAH